MKSKVLNVIKYILIGLGVLVLVTPIIVVLATGVGFEAIHSHIFLTISAATFIISTIIECVIIKMANKNQSIATKIGIIFGFVVVIITFWI